MLKALCKTLLLSPAIKPLPWRRSGKSFWPTSRPQGYKLPCLRLVAALIFRVAWVLGNTSGLIRSRYRTARSQVSPHSAPRRPALRNGPFSRNFPSGGSSMAPISRPLADTTLHGASVGLTRRFYGLDGSGARLLPQHDSHSPLRRHSVHPLVGGSKTTVVGFNNCRYG